MSKNIFVPINCSAAINAVPKGQNIVYSTKCRHENRATSVLFNPIIGKATSYKTHVLMTSQGFVCRNSLFGDSYKFVPWEEARYIGKDYLTYGDGYSLKIIFDNEFEDRTSFNERIKRFEYNVIPYVIRGMRKSLYAPTGIIISPEKSIKMQRSIKEMEKRFKKAEKKLQ
jgi:hypothetical protein